MGKTKEDYVEALRVLLEKDNACGVCPTLSWKDGEEDDCKMCFSFIHMAMVPKGYSRYMSIECPCHRIGEKALERAQRALDRWDKGVHKWQKRD